MISRAEHAIACFVASPIWGQSHISQPPEEVLEYRRLEKSKASRQRAAAPLGIQRSHSLCQQTSTLLLAHLGQETRR